jgi:SAM-dependent methyltransferase
VTRSVERCPLCEGTDATSAGGVPYATIVARLSADWDLELPDEVARPLERGGVAELVRCGGCGLEYFRGASAGDPEFYRLLTDVVRYQPQRWEYGQVLPAIPPGGAVLDLGCGDGAFLRVARASAGRVAGVDHNEDAIGALRAAGIEGSTEAFAAFASREPGAFDVVCSFHTLEHLPDARALIEPARIAVRPGGAVFVSVPNRDRAGRGDDEPLDCPPHHVSRWSARQLQELADRFDLELRSVRFEEPDFSHAWEVVRERSRPVLERVGVSSDRHPLTRAWMKAALGPRRHRSAAARHAYTDRGLFGHSMLAAYRKPEVDR